MSLLSWCYVSVLMKVILGSVADIQTQQDHPDWWPGLRVSVVSVCMRREGSVAWLPGGLLSCWCLVYSLYVSKGVLHVWMKQHHLLGWSLTEKNGTNTKHFKTPACWVFRLRRLISIKHKLGAAMQHSVSSLLVKMSSIAQFVKMNTAVYCMTCKLWIWWAISSKETSTEAQ